MRPTSFTIAALVLLASATFAEANATLPVTAIGTHRLALSGVSAELGHDHVRVSGWVRRTPSSYGPLSAHLHVEALAPDGATLELKEANWQGELPSGVRTRNRAALFHTQFDAASSIASVRVSIVAGPRHTGS